MERSDGSNTAAWYYCVAVLLSVVNDDCAKDNIHVAYKHTVMTSKVGRINLHDADSDISPTR